MIIKELLKRLWREIAFDWMSAFIVAAIAIILLCVICNAITLAEIRSDVNDLSDQCRVLERID